MKKITISYTLRYLSILSNYFSFPCTFLKLCFYFIMSLSSTLKHLTKKEVHFDFVKVK